MMAAERGWDVAISWQRDDAAGAEVLAAIRAHGRRAVGLRGDVAREADVIALFDAAERDLGGIDSVIVNAGILAQTMPLAEMSAERMQRIIDVNVMGALLTAREAARRLGRPMDQPSATVVLVSSAAARLGGSPGEFVDYAASKGALDSLNIGLSKELGGAEHPRERRPSRPDRDRDPRLGRTPGPGAAAGLGGAAGPARTGR
jgi:NAD(P)-dependent dehydrogenase (short-subunit alcohol dehydrogenase family)